MAEIPVDLFKLIVERAPHAVAIFDNQMRYQFVNQRWIEDNQLEGLSIIGRNHYELVPDIPLRWREIHQRCLKGASEKSDEDFFHRADGSTLWIRWDVRPWRTPSGEIGGIVMFTENITQRKMAQDALKQSKIELEERVEERTRELARSNAELEQFAYVTSHDLQEPLRMISLYGELLKAQHPTITNPTIFSYVNFMVEGVQRMRNLISDLLMFSRAERAASHPERVDMNQIFQSVSKNLALSIAENGASIQCDPLPEVIASPLLMQQLLQNLLSNALKFHTKGVRPKIQISAHQQKEFWVFSVADNGIGIDQRFANKIFVLFQRLHSRSEYAGTGIGLAICKKIVELNGGKIWMKSEESKGTTFYFSLPARGSQMKQHGAA